MFTKVLIANRGEIAVRIARTCREMGIYTIALYEQADGRSLHVRLADECVRISSSEVFTDADAVIAIAKARGADAVHPGIGFLAEDPRLIAACQRAGLVFIGPSAEVVQLTRNKIAALEHARSAGFQTVDFLSEEFGPEDAREAEAAAANLGLPLIVKSRYGGRGSGQRLVRNAADLGDAIRRAQVESARVYGDAHIYFERAMHNVHQIGVQVLGDADGNYVHLGERDGSAIEGNRKIIDESPSPALTDAQRWHLYADALNLSRLFDCRGAVTVEFLIDGQGQSFFTEIKPRLQTDHPLTEMVYGIDLVREQIRLAAGEPLGYTQADLRARGWALLCRINAEDLLNRSLPSPGIVTDVRVPGGTGVRFDTYVCAGAEVPPSYSRLIGVLTCWHTDRAACLARIRRAVDELAVVGPHTSLPLVRRMLRLPAFEAGVYSTELLKANPAPEPDDVYLRDLAAAAAVHWAGRNEALECSLPDRLRSGWHRQSRRLPE